nr:hypothetical protein Iba_chr10eCG15870 [Ipomoea batatas]
MDLIAPDGAEGADKFGVEDLGHTYFAHLSPVISVRREHNVGTIVEEYFGGQEFWPARKSQRSGGNGSVATAENSPEKTAAFGTFGRRVQLLPILSKKPPRVIGIENRTAPILRPKQHRRENPFDGGAGSHVNASSKYANAFTDGIPHIPRRQSSIYKSSLSGPGAEHERPHGGLATLSHGRAWLAARSARLSLICGTLSPAERGPQHAQPG